MESDDRLTYRKRLEARVRPYAPEDWPALREFRTERFGATSCQAQERYHRWLFEDGPGGAPNPLWLYRDDQGRIGGQIGALPVALRLDGREHAARWLVGLTVSPELRLRGVGAVLPEVALAGCPVGLGIEVSDGAHASFLRAGWRDLGEAPVLVHPLRPCALLCARRGGLAAAVAGPPLTALARAAQLALRFAASSRGASLVPVPALAHHADGVWGLCRDAYPLIARRDAAWIGWRFDRYPDRNRYRPHLLRVRGQTLGYAVLRLGGHADTPAAYLVDFLCPPDRLALLLSLCIGWSAGRGAAALRCLHRDPRGLSTFRKLGFLPRPSGWRQMSFAPGLSEAGAALVAAAPRWFLTAAESVSDRPRGGTVYG